MEHSHLVVSTANVAGALNQVIQVRMMFSSEVELIKNAFAHKEKNKCLDLEEFELDDKKYHPRMTEDEASLIKFIYPHDGYGYAYNITVSIFKINKEDTWSF